MRAAKHAELSERLHAVGAEPVGSTVESFAAFLQGETARWGKVLKDGGGAVPPSLN
jgi:tripartite-type tricarboxylate transporter receptor subunit TctC